MRKLVHEAAVAMRASDGIGAEVARELAAERALVVANYATSQGVTDHVTKEDIARSGVG